MPAKALMRLDTIGWRITSIVGAVCAAWVIASLIIGLTGPSRLKVERSDAYLCPQGSRHWSANCTGSQMGLGQASPWFHVRSGNIDRTWHLILRLFEVKPRSLGGTVGVRTTLQGRATTASSWVTISNNRSISMPLTCMGYTTVCSQSLLFWENDPRFDEFRVQLQFAPDPLLSQYIGDVEFEAVTTPDSYARLALGFKHAYGAISLILTIFWIVYMRCMKGWPYSAWNWEQRYLTILLVGLNLYNNPLFGIHYLVPSPFFPWLNAFAEICYVGLALALWLIHINRFKAAVMYENYLLERQEYTARIAGPGNVASHYDPYGSTNSVPQSYGSGPSVPSRHILTNNDETSDEEDHPRSTAGSGDAASNYVRPEEDAAPIHVVHSHASAYYESPEDAIAQASDPVNDSDPIMVDRYSWFYVGLATLYVLLTGGLFLWGSLRDRMTPVDGGIRTALFGFRLIYYLAAAFYTFLVILITLKLSFNALGTRRHKDLLWGRYVFFAGPTIILAFALVAGLFTSNIGPYSSNMVGTLCYSALFNTYIYFMMWAYWPIDGGYSALNSAETNSIFSDSTGTGYSSHL